MFGELFENIKKLSERFNINESSSSLMRVKDIPKEAGLVSDSQDIDAIVDMLGLPDRDEYGCLFVIVGDGEYEKVWACESSVSYNDSYVWQVYPEVKESDFSEEKPSYEDTMRQTYPKEEELYNESTEEGI